MRRLGFASLAVLGLWLGAAAPAHADPPHGGGGHGHGGGGHGGHGGSHFVFVPRLYFGGGPLWYGYPYPYGYAYGYGYPYPYPYGYAPPPVVVQPAPQVYVQPPPQQYWYYCQDPAGYYPSVARCPAGWIRVVPGSVAGGR